MGTGQRLDIMVVNGQPLTAHLLGHVVTEIWPNDACASVFGCCEELCNALDGRLGLEDKVAIIYCFEPTKSLSDDWLMMDKQCSELLLNCCLIALVEDQSDSTMDELRALGFNGVIHPSFTVQQLTHAFGLIASGINFFPDIHSKPASQDLFASHALSIRQQQVMAMLTKGLPNKRIAAQLGVSERTIKIHVSAIMKKLNADNRTHAVSLYNS